MTLVGQRQLASAAVAERRRRRRASTYAGRTDLQVIQPGLIPDPDRRAIGNATSNPYSFWTYTAT